MAEFYWQPSFGDGCPSRDRPVSPKKKKSLDEAVEFLQKQADSYLDQAMGLALLGEESARKEIEEDIAAYRSILSIVPGGADEQKIENVQKHFKLNVLVEKFKQRLEKRIFG